VAIKIISMTQENVGGDVLEEFFGREKITLENMRRLHHPHLIEAHAAFRKEAGGGYVRGFVFPVSGISVTNLTYTAYFCIQKLQASFANNIKCSNPVGF
jgi:hypothetical protein